MSFGSRFASRVGRFLNRSRTGLFASGMNASIKVLKSKSFQTVAVTTATALAFGVSAQSTVLCAGDVDYKKVRVAIADLLEDKSGNNYDDNGINHFGPVFVRLAWHASGTYCKADGTGGSNGATMRFEPECSWGANAGLGLARDRLAPLLKQFPGLTAADLWTLAGCVAIEEMGGPAIKWTPGRTDSSKPTTVPDGRLPDATQGAGHIRDIFYRMGFNDREIVALSGAHALGRCHADRSGFVGPWTRAPTTFSNEYFRLLMEDEWSPKRAPNGNKQYENNRSGRDLMMLETDLALVRDSEFKKYVQLYAKNEQAFADDFASAFAKLMDLGVKRCPHSNSGSNLSLSNGTLVTMGFAATALGGLLVSGRK